LRTACLVSRIRLLLVDQACGPSLILPPRFLPSPDQPKRGRVEQYAEEADDGEPRAALNHPLPEQHRHQDQQTGRREDANSESISTDFQKAPGWSCHWRHREGTTWTVTSPALKRSRRVAFASLLAVGVDQGCAGMGASCASGAHMPIHADGVASPCGTPGGVRCGSSACAPRRLPPHSAPAGATS